MVNSRSLKMVPLCLLLTLAAACTPAKDLLTVAQVRADPAGCANQPVRMRGYGVIAMMSPLCEGYTGMDTRMLFVDEAQDSLVAVLAGDKGDLFMGDELRLFSGTIRIFSGLLGCPGSLSETTFPYFEIDAVVEE